MQSCQRSKMVRFLDHPVDDVDIAGHS